MLLDEVVSALDDEVTIKFVDMLKGLQGMCVYLTSHKPFLGEIIGNNFSVSKENGVSKFLV